MAPKHHTTGGKLPSKTPKRRAEDSGDDEPTRKSSKVESDEGTDTESESENSMVQVFIWKEGATWKVNEHSSDRSNIKKGTYILVSTGVKCEPHGPSVKQVDVPFENFGVAKLKSSSDRRDYHLVLVCKDYRKCINPVFPASKRMGIFKKAVTDNEVYKKSIISNENWNKGRPMIPWFVYDWIMTMIKPRVSAQPVIKVQSDLYAGCFQCVFQHVFGSDMEALDLYVEKTSRALAEAVLENNVVPDIKVWKHMYESTSPENQAQMLENGMAALNAAIAMFPSQIKPLLEM